MPLTHDMGLIGFYLMQFTNHVHLHLMPTELFVRRPLLWLQVAAKKRVTITCSPNFGYRHFLKVLGDRRLEGVDLSAIRLIYNGAEPISVELCNEFMSTLAYTGLKRRAMYPVYGLATNSTSVRASKSIRPRRAMHSNSWGWDARYRMWKCASRTTPAGRCPTAAWGIS
jgi:acyl-CoA synthetase (AMP-forming)/AMP-acid ligase II